MNKHFGKLVISLGAFALLSFHAAQADGAAAADPWPVETPAQIYFGDTDNYGTGPRRPDVAATAGFGDPAEQNGPVVTASAAIVDSQRLELGERMVAEQRAREATMLAHGGNGGTAVGMH